jgi:hypothetical protein
MAFEANENARGNVSSSSRFDDKFSGSFDANNSMSSEKLLLFSRFLAAIEARNDRGAVMKWEIINFYESTLMSNWITSSDLQHRTNWSKWNDFLIRILRNVPKSRPL